MALRRADLLACYVALCDHDFFFLLSSVEKRKARAFSSGVLAIRAKAVFLLAGCELSPLEPHSLLCSGQHYSYPYLPKKEVEPQRLIK